ncbi:FCD domain-containing protein [Ottowia sp.]|uniref:FadR/GntR family transcriptional regulator n=1 Tax=Ottowia sp. TaxID=1898956 RepID=UPI002CC7C888|nr:FCD domain-containing protein [Ottowia sp.]MCP5257990.1 FadR family transcriptional regulator [Burkholderiaceae bacterium]HRW71241.1 FCD domain-containing protein [Ottowia sp.]
MNTTMALRDHLLANLAAGRWRAGDRLPTERELGDQFGISRTSVRRVLLELRELGAITQTVGSGTYVTPQAASLVDNLQGGGDPVRHTSPAELMEARLALEPAIVEMVVGNATSADFEKMDVCCEQAEAATSLEGFEHWDGMLHETIALAAHNGFVASVFRLMNQVRAQSEWGMLKKRSVTPERRLQYQAEHRALVKALKRRDVQAARAAAVAHLERVQRNLLGA